MLRLVKLFLVPLSDALCSVPLQKVKEVVNLSFLQYQYNDGTILLD